MRSGELAELAGVSVRTLRHYHQLGVLDEPRRRANGYRHYDARHLARLLRIVRLTGLGVPLAELPAILADTGSADDLLDTLDQQAAEQIDRLTARRAVIAQLRRDAAAPDLPPSLATYARTLAAAGLTPEQIRRELGPMALLAELAHRAGAEGLSDASLRMAEFVAVDAELTRRFHALGPHSSTGDIDRVVTDTVARFVPLVDELAGLGEIEDAEQLRELPGLVDELSQQLLNDQQRRANELIHARIVALLSTGIDR